MLGRNIFKIPSRLKAAAIFQYLQPHEKPAFNVLPLCSHRLPPPLISHISRSSTDSAAATDSPQPTQCYQLARVATLVDGCDYGHWLVVMEPPKGYPERREIVHQFITTLALALGSEVEAKRSIYSVSTKYYYAFGCKISENLTHKIKSLPNVRWVLPDSYLCHGENDYGGEPFVEGEVVPYDEKYHLDWLRDETDDQCQSRTRSRKSRRKERKRIYGLQTLGGKKCFPSSHLETAVEENPSPEPDES